MIVLCAVLFLFFSCSWPRKVFSFVGCGVKVFYGPHVSHIMNKTFFDFVPFSFFFSVCYEALSLNPIDKFL